VEGLITPDEHLAGSRKAGWLLFIGFVTPSAAALSSLSLASLLRLTLVAALLPFALRPFTFRLSVASAARAHTLHGGGIVCGAGARVFVARLPFPLGLQTTSDRVADRVRDCAGEGT